ncbi:MAG: metallophosphoesterase, partial [Candidatus Krumholzibacteria bacterium]|nr:metallophosphoesterase [Candidatus Krumholzibacteria bacterium]
MRLSTAALALASLLIILALPTAGSAAVSAATVTSSGQLLSGSVADGQLGDVVLANDEIILIISAIGHTTESGENGGTVIDAGTAIARIDALGELYTYFDDDWPRQAVYTSLTIVNDGSLGGPAVVRAAGYDSGNPAQAVVTDYSLADGDRHLVLTTSVTGSATQPAFELGDAFQWGSCQKYAPGYGLDVYGTTTQAWLAGLVTNVCYAYAGVDGDCWGPNGALWSDVSVTTASLVSGASVSYTRYFAVAPGEIAAAVAILYEALGVATGTVNCAVTDMAGGAAVPSAVVDVFDGSGNPFLQMMADGAGQATASIPPGVWRLTASAAGYDSAEEWVTVTADNTESLTFALSSGGGSATAVGDTLTVIQRPLVNIPTLVMPGQALDINCAADPATTGWQAEISYGAITLPLPIATASYDPATTWWTLQTTAPAVALYELYDLRVTADGGLDDTTRNAVRVLDQFKNDYYFIHISDTHLPDHGFSDGGAVPADSTETIDLRAVIADINLINPEFVLITGDFVNEGELEDYMDWRSYTRAQRQLYEFETPTYLIAGNHDIGGWNDTPPPAGTARRNWWRFFGWPRLDNPPPGAPLHTQNYSFDYGPVHFTGLEAYDNYDLWRSEFYGFDSFPGSQMAWLSEDLASAASSQSQVLFYHYDFQSQLNLSALGVEMALWGHVHGDRGSESVLPYSLATESVCDGARAYRVIRVSNGVVQPEATVQAGGNGENLAVDYAPANAGISSTVTAQITNSQPLDFEHGRLRFVMPAAGGNYQATGGQIVQVDQSGPFDICHVAVNIAANGSQSVTVSPATNDVPGSGPGQGLHLAQNQ